MRKEEGIRNRKERFSKNKKEFQTKKQEQKNWNKTKIQHFSPEFKKETKNGFNGTLKNYKKNTE